MKRFHSSMAGAAGFALLMLVPAAGWASPEPEQASGQTAKQGAAGETWLAHMGGQGDGSGMMAPGRGHHARPDQDGEAGHGKARGGMGHEMTGHKMMGHAMRGPGMMEQGMHVLPGGADRVVPIRHLTVDDVRHFLEHRLARGDNRRLAVGSVEAADDERIVAEITTADGSLVERLEVDRHTGEMRSIE